MATLFQRSSDRDRSWVRQFLARETVGGGLLLISVLAALIAANTSLKDGYHSLLNTQFGFGAQSLSLASWASEGLLAIFFLVAGLELRREFTSGSLQTLRTALLPVTAAIAGMVIPALFFALLAGPENRHAWAIPTATDLAFCLTILAVAGRSIPTPLRAFLLTLAITDDLGAIGLIAIFYSSTISWKFLLLSLLLLLIYGFLQQRRRCPLWIGIPIALLAWYAMYRSGVHGTVAGVMIGLLTNAQNFNEKPSNVERLERFIQPISIGVALPIFAFTAIGITINSQTFQTVLSDPLSRAIVIARVVGKPLGILGGAWLVARFTRAELNPEISWWDIGAIGILAGIGFSVALLVSEMALATEIYPKAAGSLLFAGLVSTLLAVVALVMRGRHHQRSANTTS